MHVYRDSVILVFFGNTRCPFHKAHTALFVCAVSHSIRAAAVQDLDIQQMYHKVKVFLSYSLQFGSNIFIPRVGKFGKMWSQLR